MPSLKKRLSPHVAAINNEATSFAHALGLFKEASVRVHAYKDFLEKHRIDPQTIETIDDFKQLPRTNKENYFSQYGPDELCWDGSFSSSQYISTSSGSSGKPFFWPRGKIHDETVGAMFQNIFDDCIDAKHGKTLCIISLAFGQWIAGFEFYNAICRVRDNGSSITIVTSSIEAQDVINKTKNLGHLFDRIVIAGYPPFIKDIVELGLEQGVNWSLFDVHLLTAGEPFTEKWRSYVLSLIGKNDAITKINNIYGMSEVGMVAHETPTSILIRHSIDAAHIAGPQHAEQVTSIYQYYPTERFFESDQDSSLLLTANADFPLIRYETRDMGGLFSWSDLTTNVQEQLKTVAPHFGIDLNKWQLPFLFLYGRKDFSVTLYGLNIYTENIKMALDDASCADELSGLFVMEVITNETMNQTLHIAIELERNKTADSGLSSLLSKLISEGLCKHNSEYAKLMSSLGEKVKPVISVVTYGSLPTVRGKKHKWVKRS